MLTIRSWVGFDPDGDSVLDLDGIRDRITNTTEPFPTDNDVHVSFLFEGYCLDLAFSNGSLISDHNDPLDSLMIHGISVLVIFEGSLLPCLMQISIGGVIN